MRLLKQIYSRKFREAPSDVVVGFVAEVPGMEVAGGGTAAKTSVRIALEKREGRWLITGYAEDSRRSLRMGAPPCPLQDSPRTTPG